MFERIKTWMRNAWWQLRRRSVMPVIARRVPRANSTGTGPRRFAGNGVEDDARSERMGPTEAAEKLFAPSHGEEESYGFSRVGQDGTVPHRGELWDRERNSMRVRRRRIMLVTCSGGVVGSGEGIKGVCSQCGGFDSTVMRCARCGAVLCQLHAHVLQHPTGPVVYCQHHLDETMNDWDTWEASDIQRGVQPKKSVFPGRPWAVARYSEQGGSKNA